jgi:uncharacterized protein (DUF488 family)
MTSDRPITIYSIGFTKISAEQFFGSLIKSGVKKIIDVRLKNISQLSGFAKKKDLEYFLRALGNIGYVHMPILAPTENMLREYREKGDWGKYEQRFKELLEERKIENTLKSSDLDNGCLLCTEETPLHCHRRLVAEYLQRKWSNVKITHLVHT